MTAYNNTTPQRDRLATLLQDKAAAKDAQRKNEASTFSQFAKSEAEQDAGRFAAMNKAAVVGATPAPEYPRQPEGSFSNQGANIPPEEPLGYSVEETPIVGEVGEVQASIDRLEAAAPAEVSVPNHSPDAVAESAAGTVQPLGPEDAAAWQVPSMSDRGAVPNQSPKRRSQQ